MKPKIWAHRGASAYAPENTLEAFELAIRQGAHGIELDVHLSADGELIVAHDEAVDRVSDGTGMIGRMTLPQLKALDFSRLHPQYSPARVPTLGEVFELIRPTALSINVEVKTNLLRYEGIEHKLIELERACGMQGRILYSSFNVHSLAALRQIDPQARIGMLFGRNVVEGWRHARAVRANALHPHFLVTSRLPLYIQVAHLAGFAVHVFTVNDPKQMQRQRRLHADAIITDRPDVAQALFAR